ncbi:hypothetical protein ACRQ5D_10855 [Mucilaginibacter sp. P25]|uniref:hypothetical protein n=1 Tax=Mucilaginibacter sp. P25 TaxID=3423945 RepID=UPI003D7B71AA
MSDTGLTPFNDRQRDDALDRIYKAWLSHTIEEDLSLQDLWILERMEFIDARLRYGGKRAIYKNLVEDTYEYFKGTHGITRRTIESDIARTRRFFLVTRPRADKEYGRGIAIEQGRRMLAKMEKAEKFKEWAILYKELNHLEGFYDKDIDVPNMAEIQPPPLMVVMDPGQIGIPVIDNLDEEIRILSIPKSKPRNADNIEDVEAEDVSE